MICINTPWTVDSAKPRENLQQLVQSLFRFHADEWPASVEQIHLATITYINYKRILELVKQTMSVLRSEMATISYEHLQDMVTVIELAQGRVQHSLSSIDTQLEQMTLFLEEQPQWKKHIWFTAAYRSQKQLPGLFQKQKKLEKLSYRIQQACTRLHASIRTAMLASVKRTVPVAQWQYILDVQRLEDTYHTFLDINEAIEEQLDSFTQNRKLAYYESDRVRIFHLLQQMEFSLTALPFQLNKAHLDTTILTPELVKLLQFNGKKGIRWYFSDRYVFQQLVSRRVPLAQLVQALDRLLQPESQQLNFYSEMAQRRLFQSQSSLDTLMLRTDEIDYVSPTLSKAPEKR